MPESAVIAPSILSADFVRLGDEVDAIAAAGADWIHGDSFGPDIIKAIRPRTTRIFDVHLMIAPADPCLETFAKAGADIITVHAKASPHLDRSLQAIRMPGMKADVTICPATAEHVLAHAEAGQKC
jgi:ribulose-phosphate 3-epimerase